MEKSIYCTNISVPVHLTLQGLCICVVLSGQPVSVSVPYCLGSQETVACSSKACLFSDDPYKFQLTLPNVTKNFTKILTSYVILIQKEMLPYQ